MAVNPISSPLPADLPTNWQTGQTVAPNGSDVGLAQQYGYNYQSQQINAAQQAINTIGAQFPNLYGKGDTVPIANGGTGGTSVAAALANLGAQPGFNLLVNSRFKYNGRNQASYAGGALTVDGWNSAPGSVTITLPDGVAVANAASISQFVQQDSTLFSKSATFAVEDSTGTVYSVSATMPESAQNTSSQIASRSTPWGSIAIWNSNTGSAFSAIISATSAVTLTAAKLEIGSVSTLAADLATAQDETIEQLRLDMYDLDPGRPAWVLTQNQNLLDNWYFVGGGSQQGGGQFPINQRGQTSYTSAGYGIDRWRISLGAETTEANVNISNNNVTVSCATGYADIQQLLENGNNFKGKKMTFSVLFDNNTLRFVSGQIPENFSDAVTTFFTNDLLWVRASNSQFFVQIRGTSGNPSTILAAKLELGPRSTLARLVDGQWVLNDPPPNFQQELAKCQRYQWAVTSTGASEWIGSGITSGTNTGQGFLPTPVPLRTNPTFSGSGLAYWKGVSPVASISALTQCIATDGGIKLSFACEESKQVPFFLVVQNGTCIFDANL